MSGVIAEGSASRKDLDAAVGNIIATLDAQANAGRDVARAIDSSAAASLDAASVLLDSVRESSLSTRRAAAVVESQLIQSIEASHSATEKLNAATITSASLVDKLDALTELESRAVSSLSDIKKQAEQATHEANLAFGHLNKISTHLGCVENALSAHDADVKELTDNFAKVERQVTEFRMPKASALTALSDFGPTEPSTHGIAATKPAKIAADVTPAV